MKVAAAELQIDSVLNFIQDNPGCYFRLIKKCLALSVGTVQYHLDRLERMGLITTSRQGLYKFYFPAGIFQDFDRQILQILMHERARDILLFIIEQKNPTQTEIVKKIGISAASISWHVQQLITSSVVEETRQGKFRRYQIVGGNDSEKCKQILKLIRNHHPSLWDNWSNRLAEMFLTIR